MATCTAILYGTQLIPGGGYGKDWRVGSCALLRAGVNFAVRPPEPQVDTPALVFCMSWCAKLEFRATQDHADGYEMYEETGKNCVACAVKPTARKSATNRPILCSHLVQNCRFMAALRVVFAGREAVRVPK